MCHRPMLSPVGAQMPPVRGLMPAGRRLRQCVWLGRQVLPGPLMPIPRRQALPAWWCLQVWLRLWPLPGPLG